MNLGTGRADLEARGYARFTDARLNAFLNTAKNRFEDYGFDWPWLKATTTGTSPITISDLRRVRTVYDPSNRRPLDRVEAEDVTDFFDTNLTLAGPALYWYLSAETVLATYPVSTATLSVRYQKFSPELSGDSDTPLIPVRYHQTWVDLAEVETLRYGVKDKGLSDSMEASVMARVGEIAGVYAMQGQPINTESLITGASVDG